MKRTFGIAAVALAIGAAPAAAQIPGIPGGPQIVFDPTNYLERLGEVAMQTEQLAQQILAMQKLDDLSVRDIRPTIARLRHMMATAGSLLYEIENLDRQYRETFPVVQGYEDYYEERREQAAQTAATLRVTLMAAQEQAASFEEGLERIQDMKGQAGDIEGHQQALELIATGTVFGLEEQVLARQAVINANNANVVAEAHRLNRKLQEEITVSARLDSLSTEPSVGPRVQARWP